MFIEDIVNGVQYTTRSVQESSIKSDDVTQMYRLAVAFVLKGEVTIPGSDNEPKPTKSWVAVR
eukprot:3812882-Alexandrium_andersonii.AAC.1